MVCLCLNSTAQRTYKPNSVLSAGTWYKLAIGREGIYKIDISLLNMMGVPTPNIPTSSIRLFGNCGRMLPEGNDIPRNDDLRENAILVNDGGDGVFNSADHILFYATGPHYWKSDSLNKRFGHEKNIYTDSSYYFLSIGGNGSRVINQPIVSSPVTTINSFNERYFHELDTINLLSSGKEWFGEEFTDAPGKTLSRIFPVSIPGLVTIAPVTVITNCIARSVGTLSRFDVRLNTQPVQQITIPSTGAGIYDLFAQQVQQLVTASSSQDNISLTYTYVPGGFNSQGWLNFFELHTRRKLDASAGQISFRDWNSVGNQAGEFIISNASSSTVVWDVTDPITPLQMQGNLSGTEYHFVNNCSRLREYVVFNSSNAYIPSIKGRISNQDLHAVSATDYIIVTHPSLLMQAERLANFHRQRNNLKVYITSTEKIYNEFASGSPDPVAIRDMVKMFYDKAATAVERPKYLLLFGDASFDYKDRIINNTNLVPAFESRISIDPLSTYASDDFYGFLDDNEDINSGLVTNLLDVGIGRVPARNLEEAKNFVDKAEAYYSRESFGQWRTNLTFVADDEDQNLHLEDAEIVSTTASSNQKFNQHKIYLDAYPQQSSSAGERYPTVNEAISNRIFNGTLILNYNGHGGARRLAEETILDQSMVNIWSNRYRLPLIITATCDFAPYDDPFTSSLGENLLLRAHTGSIALMTTTRLVFAFSNRLMNDSYLRFALDPDVMGRYKTLGEAVMVAKNHMYQTSGDVANNRKFTLLGDPALRLGFPNFQIRTSRVNNVNAPQTDTLSAGEKAIIEGEIVDNSGSLMQGFNGTLYPVVYDKPLSMQTLGNDPGSPVTSFQAQTTILFKGKATVTGGRFKFEFRVPKDLNYVYGNGRISYYAENGINDGSDASRNVIVGGSGGLLNNDNEGPVIRAWLNDERFVNGSIVNQRPVLLLKLSDSSGINTTGTGIGHDITVTIDNDNNRFFILNDYYEAGIDDFRNGNVRFQLPSFEPGTHSLKIKVWDAMNNSSEIIVDLVVVNDESLSISHVLNYPNPFTTRTQFWFEHNRPGQNMFVQILIYSLSGRIVRTIEKTINTPGNRSNELEWDARDEFGDKVGRGVYIYRITIHSYGTKPRSVIEKLVVL